jgi:hypothetical protein
MSASQQEGEASPNPDSRAKKVTAHLRFNHPGERLLTLLFEACATSLGVGGPVAMWSLVKKAATPDTSPDAANWISASVFMLVEPVASKAVRLFFARLYGILSQPEPQGSSTYVEMLIRLSDIVLTLVSGAVGAGGAIGLMNQTTRMEPKPGVEIAAFLAGYFLYSLLRTSLTIVVLDIPYRREKATLAWKNFPSQVALEARDDVVSVKTLLTDRGGKLIGFGSYSHINAWLLRIWLNNGPGRGRIWLFSCINMGLFFAYYDLCMYLALRTVASVETMLLALLFIYVMNFL